MSQNEWWPYLTCCVCLQACARSTANRQLGEAQHPTSSTGSCSRADVGLPWETSCFWGFPIAVVVVVVVVVVAAAAAAAAVGVVVIVIILVTVIVIVIVTVAKSNHSNFAH